MSLLLRCGLICTLPPRHCWAGPGWARAGGRAGLGQGGRPTGGAALAAVSELGLFVGWAGRAAGGPAAWAGRGWRPVGGAGMLAALATVSELVRAGLGRLVRRLGWASGWSVAGGPAACHGAALPVGRQQSWAGAGGQWAGLLWASCAGGCWPVRAGLGKLVGQLSWTVPRPTTEEPPLPWR